MTARTSYLIDLANRLAATGHADCVIAEIVARADDGPSPPPCPAPRPHPPQSPELTKAIDELFRLKNEQSEQCNREWSKHPDRSWEEVCDPALAARIEIAEEQIARISREERAAAQGARDLAAAATAAAAADESSRAEAKRRILETHSYNPITGSHYPPLAAAKWKSKPAAPKTKECDECGKANPLDQVVCKFCDSLFPLSTIPKPEPQPESTMPTKTNDYEAAMEKLRTEGVRMGPPETMREQAVRMGVPPGLVEITSDARLPEIIALHSKGGRQ